MGSWPAYLMDPDLAVLPLLHLTDFICFCSPPNFPFLFFTSPLLIFYVNVAFSLALPLLSFFPHVDNHIPFYFPLSGQCPVLMVEICLKHPADVLAGLPDGSCVSCPPSPTPHRLLMFLSSIKFFFTFLFTSPLHTVCPIFYVNVAFFFCSHLFHIVDTHIPFTSL